MSRIWWKWWCLNSETREKRIVMDFSLISVLAQSLSGESQLACCKDIQSRGLFTWQGPVVPWQQQGMKSSSSRLESEPPWKQILQPLSLGVTAGPASILTVVSWDNLLWDLIWLNHTWIPERQKLWANMYSFFQTDEFLDDLLRRSRKLGHFDAISFTLSVRTRWHNPCAHIPSNSKQPA